MKRRLRSLSAVAAWAYLVAMLFLWAWLYWDGDRTWLATLFLFGPRWVVALPLPLLVAAALLWRRWALAPLAIASLIVLSPIMGFEFHWPTNDKTPALRVLTCNVEEDVFSKLALAELIERERPDVVALQEVSSSTIFIWPDNWHVVKRDEFIVGSPHPVTLQENVRRPDSPGQKAAVRFTIAMPAGEIQVFNLHLESPRAGIEAVLNRNRILDSSKAGYLEAIVQIRAAEAKKVSQWVRGFPGPKIVLGDFNMPDDSTIFRQHWSFLGDAFTRVGLGFGFTKTSGKRGLNYGSRIDHILYSSDYRPLRCWVADDIGSDHRPLIAEFR